MKQKEPLSPKHQVELYVILLNWNGAADTLRCLRAVSLSHKTPTRVIVVDNDSEPADRERLRAGIARWGLPVELVETDHNLGFGGGCNIGIRLALDRGADFIWLLNNDAVPHPNALQSMMSVIEEDDELGAVGSVIYDLDRPNRIQTWGGGRVWHWAGMARHCRKPIAAQRLDYLTAASILLRREALEQVGLFDEEEFFMYWEDTDLCFRLRARNWKLGVAEDSVIWHQRSSSLGHANPLKDYYVTVSSLRFSRRYAHWPRLSMMLSVLGRIGRRLLRGQWQNARAIIFAMAERPYDFMPAPAVASSQRETDPLRVAVEATTLAGRLAGIGHYTFSLCQSLVSIDSIILACFTAYSWGQSAPKPEGRRITRSMKWRKYFPFGREFQLVLQHWHLSRLERYWQPDLILGPNFILPSSQAPSILVVHDLSHIRYPELHPSARVAFFDRHLRSALARASAVLTVSQYTEGELLRYFPEVAGRTQVVYPGTSEQFAAIPAPEIEMTLDKILPRDGRRFFLFLSTLEPRKNITALLAAYAVLPSNIRKLHPLVLVGQMGWQQSSFADSLAQMMEQGDVLMLGYLPDNLLPALYRRALALVYPSLYEGFGLPPLEAMAAGCPVLVSNVTAMPEVCGNAALYCDPFDVDSIAAQMRRLAEDAELRARLAAAGPSHSALYTWSAAAEQVRNLMYEVAGRD